MSESTFRFMGFTPEELNQIIVEWRALKGIPDKPVYLKAAFGREMSYFKSNTWINEKEAPLPQGILIRFWTHLSLTGEGRVYSVATDFILHGHKEWQECSKDEFDEICRKALAYINNSIKK